MELLQSGTKPAAALIHKALPIPGKLVALADIGLDRFCLQSAILPAAACIIKAGGAGIFLHPAAEKPSACLFAIIKYQLFIPLSYFLICKPFYSIGYAHLAFFTLQAGLGCKIIRVSGISLFYPVMLSALCAVGKPCIMIIILIGDPALVAGKAEFIGSLVI